MKSIRVKLFFYLVFILSFLTVLLLYIEEYKRIYSTSNQTTDEKIVISELGHLDKFQVSFNDIESNTSPLLIFRFKSTGNKFDQASYTATKQIDSLKQLCGNAHIPCNEIFQLDSLFRQHLILARTIVDLSKHGEINNAIQLLNSATNESGKSALIHAYENLSKQGRDNMQLFHRKDDIRSRYMYGAVGLAIVIMLLFLGYILLRLLKQINRKDRLLQQYKIFENAADGHIVTDSQFNINYFNSAINKLFDVKDRQINGKPIIELFADGETEKNNSLLVDGFKKMQINSFDYLHKKTGKWLRINIFPSSQGFTINLKDISALKEAEDELQKSKRLYEFISRSNDLILHAKDAEQIYREICSIAMNSGNFLFVWIGIADDATATVTPIHWAGNGEGYLDKKIISAKNVPEGSGPTGKALREGKFYYCNDIETDPAMFIWRDDALKRGFRSSIALPVKVEGKNASVITMYAPKPFFFTPQQIQLLVRVTDNISFALNAFTIDRKRREAERQLQKVTRAVEQSSASVVITNLKGDIEFINAAFSKLSGYSLEEVIGKNPRVLKSGHTTTDEYNKLWHDITHFQEWKGEFLNRKKNGEMYWESAVISPVVDEQGTITSFVAVKENITEKKRLEEEQNKLLAIVENTIGYVGISDMHNNFIYANKALKDIFEIKEEEEITKLNLAEFLSPQSVVLTGDAQKIFMETGKWAGENVYLSRSGKEIPVFQIRILHKNELGIPVYISSTGIDLSGIKKAEKELLHLNNELREFSKHLQYVRETEKNKIAKEVHDELGQGLAALKFDVSWIKKHLYGDKTIIEEKIDGVLDSISEKLAAFRKIYISANTTMLQELGLNASVEYLIGLFTKAGYIPVKFTSNIESEQISPANSLALYRVLEESLSNITLHSGATEVSISLLKKDNLLNLLIQDNGRGFDAAKVDTRSNHGILEMRERIYAMDGKFTIITAAGQGTRISIEVPLCITDELTERASVR